MMPEGVNGELLRNMSTASDSSEATASLRRLPFTVRLAPSFVNPLLAMPAGDKLPTAGVDGLLFGVSDATSVHVLKTHPCSFKPLLEHAEEKRVLQTAFDAAHKDPELKELSLLGWYGMRQSGGLLETDIEFHSRHFPHPGDLAIIIRPHLANEIICELYSRSIEGVLSEDSHRWGAVRLARNAKLEASTEVIMRAQMRDDFFLRAYQQTYEPEAEAKPSFWTRVFGGGGRKPLDRLPEPPPSRPSPSQPMLTARSQSGNELARTHDIPSFLSASTKPAGNQVLLWILAVALFGLAAVGTFAVVRSQVLPNNLRMPAHATSPLGLRVEGQGSRILVTWDRNGATAKSSASGRLFINDGAQQQTISLDANQIANGSVLFSPNSADVTLRLEFLNEKGEATGETLRLLDGSSASPGSTKISNLVSPATPR